MLSEAYGRVAMKKSSVFEWHKRFRGSRERGRWSRKCSSLSSVSSASLFTLYSFHKAKTSTRVIVYVEILKRLREAVCRTRPEICLAQNQIDNWNGTPTLFPWFGPEWLVALSKNKICLKVTKISEHIRHQQMWRRHWKLFHNRSSKNVSNSGGIVGLGT
jgi:hypothetical protein